jgi:hypothetical protein
MMPRNGSWTRTKPVLALPRLPGRRSDEEGDACPGPSFLTRVAVAFVEGAAPVLAPYLLH